MKQPKWGSGLAHTQSYYAATLGELPTYPTLNSNLDIDVAIVGAGYCGLSAAIELAQQGRKVALIEGARVGWGASGRNGGQILGDYKYSYDEFADMYGTDAAKAFAAMSEEGKQIIHQRAAQFDIDIDYQQGHIFLASYKPHMAYIDHVISEGEKWGYAHERRFIGASDLPDYVGSDKYLAGVLDQGHGHMHPLKLAVGEARAAEQLGVKLFEQTHVQSIMGGDKPRLITDGGVITANQVLLTGNCYLGNTAPKLARKIMPAGTYMIATEPLSDELAAQLIPQNHAFCDMRNILDYFRLSADNRMLFGGKVIYSGKDPRDIGKAMLKDLAKVFKPLADVRIDYAWGGYIDLAVNRSPHLGEYQPNVYYAQGLSGHGVSPTHILGRVLAEKLMGNSERYDLFNQMPHYTYPGGTLLRKPGFVAGSAAFYLKDFIDSLR